MASIERIKSTYRTLALLVFNTFLLLLILNVFAALILLVLPAQKAKPVNQVLQKYDLDRLTKVYPNYTREQIVELLDEIWTGPFQYAPFVQFQERPFAGKYMRVSTNGFRLIKDQAAWPPSETNWNIFVFGGSTTFGYGVADTETVPSFLQEILRAKTSRPVAVYNFGRGFYYSTQERILFEQLLQTGFRPNTALFIDGLNDFFYMKDEPQYTRVLGNFMNRTQASAANTQESGLRLDWLPAAKLIKRLSPRPAVKESSAPNAPPDTAPARFDQKQYDDPKLFDFIIERWDANRQLIEAAGEKFGVNVAFVWQPLPVYQYDLAHHPFAEGGFGPHAYAHFGYPMVEMHLQQNQRSNTLWAGNIQKDWRKPLYVDKVHYTAEMSRMFAEKLADFLIERGLVKNEN